MAMIAIMRIRDARDGPPGGPAGDPGQRARLPGGGAGPDASPPEKVYFVLRGELTIIVNGKETVLKANDSCVIEPNETREIINRGNEVCSIVVALANPPK